MKMHYMDSLCVFAFIILSIACGSSSIAKTQSIITATEAKNYVGQNKTVCGKVASAKYSTNSRRKPTFLNLDEPYPRQVFTVVIWESDRSKFGEPDKELLNKSICVSGMIEKYRDAPEIILREKAQLKVE